jgi:hypothetical protein
MDKAENRGVSPSGIAWKLEEPTNEERALVAKIKFDLSLVPDAEIATEWARRAARKPGAGRQKILRPCPKCGERYSSRLLRTHIPLCKSTDPS